MFTFNCATRNFMSEKVSGNPVLIAAKIDGPFFIFSNGREIHAVISLAFSMQPPHAHSSVWVKLSAKLHMGGNALRKSGIF